MRREGEEGRAAGEERGREKGRGERRSGGMDKVLYRLIKLSIVANYIDGKTK